MMYGLQLRRRWPKVDMRWTWRHPVVVALQGIGPFLKWLARLVNIGSRASYRRWKKGSTTQEYMGASDQD
jgi:hypothetical protein